jgi:signal peptidase I
MLAILGSGFLVGVLSAFTESIDPDFANGGFILLTIWPTLAVHVKRWHDRDKSAWWFVLLFLGGLGILVGLWILIECVFFSGSTESNNFGPSPEAGLSSAGEADRFQTGLVVVLISLIILGTCFYRYRMPAGSMMPTLLVGDFIIADRTVYGIPMPFTNRQLMTLNSPSRGDVVVFRYPKDPPVEYIKRVVGIPGDRIGYYDKILYINGKPVEQVPVDIYVGKGSGASMSGASERIEELDDKQHKILVMPEAPGD